MAESKGKKQINAKLDYHNWRTFAEMAAEADLPQQEHKFAGVLLNLASECFAAAGMPWPEFRSHLPAYDKVAARRRKAAAARMLAEPSLADRVAERLGELDPEGLAEAEHAIAAIESRRRGRSRPKARAG